MGIRRTTIDRVNEAKKASVPTIAKGKPLDARGNEGDLTFRRTSEGLKLYIKANHKWHGIKVGESFDSLEKKINEIKSKVDTIKQFRLPSTYSVNGDFTLDVSGDIDLDADGGQVAIKDAGGRHFLFDCDNTKFTIYDDQDAADTFNIQIAEHGATTITTVDGGATNADLGIDIDGAITLTSAGGTVLDANAFIRIDSRNGSGGPDDGTIFRENGTTFAVLTAHHALSTFLMYEQGGAATNDYYLTEVGEHGATILKTVDAAAAAAHFEIEADGNITLDSADEIVIDHTNRFKFKKAGTEYVKFDTDGSSQFTMFEQGGASTDDYFKIDVATHGATTLSTVDVATGIGEGTAADLTFDVDGDIVHEANQTVGYGSHIFKGAAYQWAIISGSNLTSSLTLSNPADTGDKFNILTGANGATTISSIDNQIGGYAAHLTLDPLGELNLTPHTEVKSDAPLKIKEAANAVADTAAYGQLWVKTATPNELYFTTDAGNDIQLTSGTSTAGGGGGTQRWTNTSGGYKTNNNSSSFYYFQFYPNYFAWVNADSSSTTLSYTDSYAYNFCAPADGTLTNIRVTCRASDTGTTDPLKFYVFKGVPGNEAISLTQIGVTGTITPVASKQMYLSTDISSSNTFSAGDKLWIMLKKDSTSGNQDLYFAVSISGEYD
jgi:hypothetical protein